jgi:hypothetical protein
MKEFDFYGTAGVIAPGMVLVVGIVALFFPDRGKELLGIADVSLGSLGVGLILAYVAGQLLQAIGNGVEAVWWRLWGGMPTDWIRTGKREIVAPAQRELVQSRVREIINDSSFTLSHATNKHWYVITRQIYAAVAAANRSARVDIFNGNYGLCRGIAAALLLLLAGSTVVHWWEWNIELVLALLMALAVYRMHRFGVRYGRELFVQYLQLPATTRSGQIGVT